MRASDQHSNPQKPTAFAQVPPAPKRDEFEDFVYLLSHDVRASVRALLEVPQWIKEDLIEEGHTISGSLSENISLMDTHTKRLDRMLIDLLSYSRVARNQQILPIDLAEAIETVMEQLSPPRSFNFVCDIQLDPIIFGEQDILTLISALVSNVVKHHDQAGGHIYIKAFEDAETYTITVTDDGPGILEKHQDRVFSAMITLKPRDEVEGSGMGLAIARKIVDHYGGEISIANVAPHGLKVTMDFDKSAVIPPATS